MDGYKSRSFRKGKMMFRKILLGAALIFIVLGLAVSPVSAIPDRELPIPTVPNRWKLVIKTGGPCTDPDDDDWQLWYYQFRVIMPPVSYPVLVIVSKDGFAIPGQAWEVLFSDSLGWHSGPVWEKNAPDTITYTFKLTAGDIVVSKDVTIDFTQEDCRGIIFD